MPVARVAVDVSLPHLDRLFDYLVDAGQDEAARPGCRVRVRFSGQLVDGFVLERAEASEHGGRLSYLERVARSAIEAAVSQVFDLRPASIIRDLDLLRPIYRDTAAYGHFGREDRDFTWERTDRVDALRAAVGLSDATPAGVSG